MRGKSAPNVPGKAGFMRREHGHGFDVMHTIKQALDPLNILNPGKILPA
jgi:D-lactate dehydrogenase (cytochrome)